MVMPDDKNIAWTNTLGMAALLSVLYAAAYILSSFQPTLLEILVTCFALALVTLVAVNYYSRSVYENVSCRMWTNRAILGFTVALLGGVALQVRLIVYLHTFLGWYAFMRALLALWLMAVCCQYAMPRLLPQVRDLALLSIGTLASVSTCICSICRDKPV
jgi:hypothetical protein